MQLHGCGRHCRHLCQSLTDSSSQTLRAACAQPQPYSRRVMPRLCPDMPELVWGELGTLVRKICIRRKRPLYLVIILTNLYTNLYKMGLDGTELRRLPTPS